MESRRPVEDFSDLQIAIYPTGDDARLHFHNDPGNPYQRDTIVQRKGRVNIGCKHQDVVHGYFSKDIDDLCTLIVVQLRFESNGIASRIKEAHVVFTFSAMEMGKSDPEVIAMYPDGSFFVEPTRQHEHVVTGTEANASSRTAGVQVGGALKREKSVDRDTTDYTRVHGSRDVRRVSNFGNENAVSWNFFENKTTKTGVVTSFQGAILLERKNMDPFKASISVKATADTFSRVSAVFKKDEKDDDLWYNPEIKPKNRLRTYDGGNLGTLDLKSLSDVTFRTVLGDTVKIV
jgi:hypothetical protein